MSFAGQHVLLLALRNFPPVIQDTPVLLAQSLILTPADVWERMDQGLFPGNRHLLTSSDFDY